MKIPSFIDRRARKGGVTSLAEEITTSNDKAIVISDMVRGVDKVMNFQSMKGVNGLEPNDIYTVATCLSPAKYAERGGPGCLNRIFASISGASAGVRLPCGGAAA
jgi:hypothetical protein